MPPIIPIQFVSALGDWPMYFWPAVPRIGDHVTLPADDNEDTYIVRRVVWDVMDSEARPATATVYVEYVCSAEDFAMFCGHELDAQASRLKAQLHS